MPNQNIPWERGDIGRFMMTEDPRPGGDGHDWPNPLTDADAEHLLPHYRIVFEKYHELRKTGNSPEAALEETLAQWSELTRTDAFVPHRRRS